MLILNQPVPKMQQVRWAHGFLCAWTKVQVIPVFVLVHHTHMIVFTLQCKPITPLCLEYSILPRGAEYYVNSMNNDNRAAEVFLGIICLHSSSDVYSHNPSSSSRQQKNSASCQYLAPAVLWSTERHAHVCFHPYTVFTSSETVRQTQQEGHLVKLLMHSAICLFQTLQQS